MAAIGSPPPLLLLVGVRAVDPAQQLDDVVDVVVEDGVIRRVGRGAATDDLRRAATAEIIQGEGLLLLPAFVDLHAHLREPGQEYKEDIASGLAAAAAGGFAHVCAMPNTRPVNDNRSITEAMIARARALSGPALHPIGAITMGQKGTELTEMADLKDAGAVAVSDDGRCVTSSAVMRRALEYAKTFDMPVIQHAEDHALTEGAQMHEGAIATRLGLRGWPRVAEDIIVARDVLLAEATGARYHVAHVSSLGAVRILREAKARGIAVTAEVTPHHLLLTEDLIAGYDPRFKVNPPLRRAEDVEALRAALADGTIDIVATDHAPHPVEAKESEWQAAANGMVGLESALAVVHAAVVETGFLNWADVARVMSSTPARIGRLHGHGESIAVGAAPELTLYDPAAASEFDLDRLAGRSTNSPYLGRRLPGRVVATFHGGYPTFLDGAVRPHDEVARHAASAQGVVNG